MNPFEERINLLHLELAGTARTVERSAQLREQLAQLQDAVALACPNCKEHDGLADVTIYPGVCDGTFARLADGTIDFDGDGETDVCWDSGVAPADGNSVQCDCGWAGKPNQLVEYVETEDEDEEYECEDCSVNGEGCRTHGAALKAARQAIMADPERVFAALVATGLVEGES